MGQLRIRPDKMEFYDPDTDKTMELRPGSSGYIEVYDPATGHAHQAFGQSESRKQIKRTAAGVVQFATAAGTRGTSAKNTAKISAGATGTITATVTIPADYVQANIKAKAGTKAKVLTAWLMDGTSTITTTKNKSGTPTVTTTLTGTKHQFSKPIVKAKIKALTGAIAVGSAAVSVLGNTFTTEKVLW